MDKPEVIAVMAAILQAPDLGRSSAQCVLLARKIYEQVEAKLNEAKEGKTVTPA